MSCLLCVTRTHIYRAPGFLFVQHLCSVCDVVEADCLICRPLLSQKLLACLQ